MADYKMEIEIFEGKGGQLCVEGETTVYPDVVKGGVCAWMFRGDWEQSYRVGDRFSLLEDEDKICPWLLDSLSGIVEKLSAGETLGWEYKDTPYDKVIDPEGITTEFIRCIDPTDSGIVVKVIRTRLSD